MPRWRHQLPSIYLRPSQDVVVIESHILERELQLLALGGGRSVCLHGDLPGAILALQSWAPLHGGFGLHRDATWPVQVGLRLQWA
jgi:hypothetical protein